MFPEPPPLHLPSKRVVNHPKVQDATREVHLVLLRFCSTVTDEAYPTHDFR